MAGEGVDLAVPQHWTFISCLYITALMIRLTSWTYRRGSSHASSCFLTSWAVQFLCLSIYEACYFKLDPGFGGAAEKESSFKFSCLVKAVIFSLSAVDFVGCRCVAVQFQDEPSKQTYLCNRSSSVRIKHFIGLSYVIEDAKHINALI